MLGPVLLFVTSVAGWIATMLFPGLADLLVVAIPCVLASLLLLHRAIRRRGERGLGGRPNARPNWILIDGSNVMHWKGNTPQIEALQVVIGQLTSRGYVPGVIFDANAGYLIAGKYQHDRALGRLLGLPEDRVMVVPKGTPADKFLLEAARDLGARIVTNDRYRDWADAHPEVNTRGFLIRGGFRDTGLWLDLREGVEPAKGAMARAG